MACRLRRYLPVRPAVVQPRIEGKLTRVVGLMLEAVGCQVSLGSRCLIDDASGGKVEAEVVGFDGPTLLLMPLRSVQGLQPGARVVPAPQQSHILVGSALLGRVLDALGEPIDTLGPLDYSDDTIMAGAHKINPLRRQPINRTLDVGIAAINALVTVGRGQRIGLFAGSGVGKSVLLGMMTRFTEAEVIVVGLIGERGREVKEFIDEILGAEGLARAVVIASPADDSPLMRLRAAALTTVIAEGFRAQGKDVLLLMDSLTRYAMAQREIALATGEPPATKGYPPSVFARIPQLVERAGNADKGEGSITAFYTVLTEGDDQQDPIADAARAILDGHVVLSRRLAEQGHYPAIDIEASLSRVMPAIAAPDHLAAAQMFRRLYARYQQNQDLISVGAYAVGSDRDIDMAIERMPHLLQFLQQGLREQINLATAVQKLKQVIVPKSERDAEPAAKSNVTSLSSRTLGNADIRSNASEVAER
ncbi:MAG: flagellar protein export ATPase FliI [Pseudomonadales bacterium]|nr:flagellar protein export ATPase FliI [Pseudomonadales bacterium]